MSEQQTGGAASNTIGAGAQTGDVSIRDTAARDIYQGADANLLAMLLREKLADDAQYRILDLKMREVRQGQVDAQLLAIKAELRLQRWCIIIGLIALVLVLAMRG